MIYLKDFIFCFVATFTFAIIMKTPKKILIYTSLLSSIGYIILDFILINYNHIFLGYFISILFISIIGEILSIKLNTSSIIIIFPAIIAFVPGIGLFKTILNFIEKDIDSFSKNCYETILLFLLIAIVVAITKYIFDYFKKLYNNAKNKKEIY